MVTVGRKWRRQLVEFAAHQGNRLELADPAGEVSLVTVELGLTKTNLGEVFSHKGELVASSWRCVQLSWAIRVVVGSLLLASGLTGSLWLTSMERVRRGGEVLRWWLL